MEKKFDLDYLELLSKNYPTVDSVCTEIINLTAITNLHKGTEHFLTDIHGENESFDHVLRNASGVVKRKINDTFGVTLTEQDKKDLASLVYYPKEKLAFFRKQGTNTRDWYESTIYRLVLLCRATAYKYTRSKVRKALPKDFTYIIEELFHENENTYSKQGYYNAIIDCIIDIDHADRFIIAMAEVIRQFVVDRLHIIGDIYDRGPGAHICMDLLMKHHAVDIQWGNHDMLWMGAAAGSEACIANTLRIALRYGNLETLQDGYGINLSPLIRFTMDHYNGPYSPMFNAKVKDTDFKAKDIDLLSRMQKAISIIQFKLEGQIIQRRPEFNMEDRLLLSAIDYSTHTIQIDGIEYPLNDTFFPTIDPSNPYTLSDDEIEVVEKLKSSFSKSDKLHEHIAFLYNKGDMYLKHNGNLLYHGCVPLNTDGSFRSFNINNTDYKGKSLFDFFGSMANKGYYSRNAGEKLMGLDYIWYIWCGEFSPLFGKTKMATFERYFIDSESTHKEGKDPYYALRDNEELANRILVEFGLETEHAHIVNGHVPVKVAKGELPIKANGKLICIDGGFAKAYQKTTGIAGYTLIYNSQGMHLVSHKPFSSKADAISKGEDMLPTTVFVRKQQDRITVGMSDTGQRLQSEIAALKALLSAYRSGSIHVRS